ncbi:hypothetical protein FRC07_007250, partial [Ceratobasidium sp. 392]
SLRDVYKYLVDHGCVDLTSQLDLLSFPEAAFSGGRFGDVWSASLRNRTKIAVKCLRLHTANESHSRVLKHAARELYYWSKLKHVYVLELLGFAMFKGQLAMVSPWMENGTLNDYIRKDQEKDRWHLSNILIAAYGIPKLTDFGNAVLANYSLAFSGTNISGGGTSRWMAPELIMQEDETTADRSMAADIYAFGMTIL